MKLRVLVVTAFVLGACADQGSDITERAGPNRDPGCGEAADGRVRDAVVNGIDKALLDGIWQNAYTSCMTWKKKTHLSLSSGH
jgi:hypothetical protein